MSLGQPSTIPDAIFSSANVRGSSAIVLDVTSPLPCNEFNAKYDPREKPNENTDRVQPTADITDSPMALNSPHLYHKLNLDQQGGFWEAHNKQAADYDEKLIKRLKEDLNTLLIFVSPSS